MAFEKHFRRKQKRSWNPAAFVPALVPRKPYALILAGLLTYPVLSGLPDFSVAQADTKLWRSIQQRVCSGFSPDSLFIVSPEWKKSTPKSNAKIQHIRSPPLAFGDLIKRRGKRGKHGRGGGWFFGKI
jgi:hypothetical protein